MLESAEFHFTVTLQLKDGTPVTALLAGTHAEQMFGNNIQLFLFYIFYENLMTSESGGLSNVRCLARKVLV